MAQMGEIMNDWIEWNGGECPVTLGTKITAKFRQDEFEKEPFVTTLRINNEDTLQWVHNGNPGDIVAYKIEGE
jgi:hypothetical protein